MVNEFRSEELQKIYINSLKFQIIQQLFSNNFIIQYYENSFQNFNVILQSRYIYYQQLQFQKMKFKWNCQIILLNSIQIQNF
ncbi:hypothetical protein pb186bvf_013851 [Paramecium bursaria]